MRVTADPAAAEETLTAAGVGGTEGAVGDAGGTDLKTRVALSIPEVRPTREYKQKGEDGARGRSRTDTLLRAADFLATSAFAAAR